MGGLPNRLPCALRATSTHLIELANADLVVVRKEGLRVRYRISDELDPLAKRIVEGI